MHHRTRLSTLCLTASLLQESNTFSISGIPQISKFLSVAQESHFPLVGKGHNKYEYDDEKYDPENEQPEYIYDRGNGDDDVHRRKKNLLEWLFTEYPQLLPNHNSDESDLHHVDRNHMVDQDFRLSFQQITTDNGFRYEEHTVTTEDGYILTMFRVRHQETPDGAPAVLLQHGLIDTADCWIMNHADESPGFVLADEGYDVWFGNSRGNRNSRNHVSLDNKIPEDHSNFFDFSWQEMGDYDAPAQIEKVLNITGQDSITFVGHNMGNTQMFYALSSENQMWFKDKINLFVALAPTTKMDHTKSRLLKNLDFHYTWIDWWIKYRGWHEVFGWVWLEIFKVVCGIDVAWCSWGETFLVTTNERLDDQDRFQVYMGHMPGGGSAKSFLHYAQSISSEKFELFDYGSNAMNNLKYGQSSPPEVDLKKIENTKVPVAMFVGNEDELADIEDTEWVRDQILDDGWGSDVLVHYEEFEAGHYSFMVGENMKYLESLVHLISKYNPIPEEVEAIEQDFNQFDLDQQIDKYIHDDEEYYTPN